MRRVQRKTAHMETSREIIQIKKLLLKFKLLHSLRNMYSGAVMSMRVYYCYTLC